MTRVTKTTRAAQGLAACVALLALLMVGQAAAATSGVKGVSPLVPSRSEESASLAGGGCALIWDDFEAYAVGSGINGQDGWETWDRNPAWDAPVSDDVAYSGTNSLFIGNTSDIVHQVVNAQSGTWTAQVYVYVPSGSFNSAYFIMTNEYTLGGPYNWTIQINFWADLGFVLDDFTFDMLPLVYDRWTEVRVEIDLDNDLCRIFYDGVQLGFDRPWAIQGGPLQITAIDLFSNGASGIYYDDISLSGVDITPPVVVGSLEAATADEDSDAVAGEYTVRIEGTDNCTTTPLVQGFLDVTGNGATCDAETPDFAGYPVANGDKVILDCNATSNGCGFVDADPSDEDADADAVLHLSGPAMILHVTGEDDAGNLAALDVIERCPDPKDCIDAITVTNAMGVAQTFYWYEFTGRMTTFDVGGETGSFPTSCSQCLSVGDVSGSLTVTCVQGGRKLAKKCKVADDAFAAPCP